MVIRRFSDFEALLWSLKPLGPPWSEVELPPKRFWNRHDPTFLEERKDLLQQLLDTLLSAPAAPAPLRDFLEMDVHIGEDVMDYAEDVNAEHDRLESIVANTSAALIDVTRMGNEDFILDSDTANAQRLAVLRDANAALRHQGSSALSACGGAGRLPVPSAAVLTEEGLLDVLTSPPPLPLEDQTQLVEKCGLALADAVRDAASVEIGEGHDLVRHMQVPQAAF